MNLSAIKPRKSGTEAQAATETARRNFGASNGGLLFKDTRPVVEAVAKGLREALPVKPVAPAVGSIDGVLSVVKAMNEGIAQLAAAIKTPVAKAAPTPAQRPAAEEAQRAPKRATTVALSPSGNAPYLPIETEAQRRRSRDDAVAAQRSVESAAADRVLVSKGGAKVLALRALDPSLSANALVILTHILRKWNEADRRPVRVRASDASDTTGLTTAEAQAALDELEAARATIVAVNSVGTRLVMPSHAVAGE